MSRAVKPYTPYLADQCLRITLKFSMFSSYIDRFSSFETGIVRMNIVGNVRVVTDSTGQMISHKLPSGM